VNTLKPDSSDEAAAAAASESSPAHDVAIDIPTTHRDREAAGRGAMRDAEVERVREVGGPELAAPAMATGGSERPRRLVLIGLDGATPDLALGAWRGELDTLRQLGDRGLSGRLRSSVPWSSLPAWLSLLTGQDPGQLGVYGQRRRVNHSYAPPAVIDSSVVADLRLWDLLGRAGKHVGVVGAPATTPAPAVRGHLVGDQMLDGAPATYPPALRQQVALWLEDAPHLRSNAPGDDLDLLLANAYARTEQRFHLARRLLARDTYDCFAVFDDGIATVQRALWDALDPAHPRYSAANPFAGAISAFYRFVDGQIADLLDLVDDDTAIAVVSACGARALDGELALNDWLIEQGDLVLHTLPGVPAPLERCEVDWERTRAWAGDDGAIYLNVAGREPHGTIPAAQVEQFCADLTGRLRGLAAPHAAVQVEVYRPAILYADARGVAPDLLVTCGQSGWHPVATLGRGAVWISAGDTLLEAACESPIGFLVLFDPRNPGRGREIDEASIYDITPTLLALFEQPAAVRLRGRPLDG
jgi:predicted AlkP superfamily phosphohydrolase/phosphomutase